MNVDKLNACFAAFPEETKALLHHWVPCPPGMEDHVFHRELPNGTKTVSVLGLLNATIFNGEGVRLAYVTEGDLSLPREEELASIVRYTLVPISQFIPTEPKE